MAISTSLKHVLVPLAGLILAFSSGQGLLLAQANRPEGALRIQSDVQEANARTGLIIARGNVRLQFPSRQVDATSDLAEYDSRRRIVTLRGNVLIRQAGNSVRAEVVTYTLDTGKVEAMPAAQKQVESVYIIPEAPAPAPEGAAPGTP